MYMWVYQFYHLICQKMCMYSRIELNRFILKKEEICFVFWILRILRSFQHHTWQMLWIILHTEVSTLFLEQI